MVQQLGLHIASAGCTDLICGWGTKSPHAVGAAKIKTKIKARCIACGLLVYIQDDPDSFKSGG